MFCIKCGNKLPANGAFCINCGSARSSSGGAGIKPAVNPIATVQAMSASNKKMIMIGVAVLMVVIIAFAAFGGGGELRGTWVHERSGDQFPVTIRFTGNRFTITEYFGGVIFRSAVLGIAGFDRLDRSSHTPVDLYELSRGVPSSARNVQLLRTDLDLWVWYDRNTVQQGINRITTQGRYSISGDILELVFSDGTIQTHSFSRTENTLNIRNHRFIRR